MLYAAIAFQKGAPGYGLVVPDVPGCVTQGATIEEAVANAAEALAGVLEGETPPRARDLEAILSDPACQEFLDRGAVVFVTYPRPPHAMEREIVSLAPELADALDRVAAREGLSRDAQVDRAMRAALAADLAPV